MKRPKIYLALLVVCGSVLGAALAVVVTGAASLAGTPPNDTTSHTREDGPPPPPFNRWISPVSGKFSVPEWDDRHISAEEKAKNPAIDPRWKPFSECLAARKLETRPDPTRPFVKADLDRLLNGVNTSRPDPGANKRIRQGEAVQGLAGGFLECADEWLSIRIEDFSKFGLTIPPIE